MNKDFLTETIIFSKLEDCPCDTCIVTSICRKACTIELDWYSKLKISDKSKYLRSDKFKFSEILRWYSK
ncbi:MAG: hypothetical protein ACFFG0_00370 [Candidatus Thorarchaeota archaeon]